MKNYKNILFDVDGTLLDSKEGIINSYKYALSHFGISIEEDEVLYKLIGPPLREAFSKYYKFNEEDTELAVKLFREYYKEKGLFQNKLYEGITILLEDLSKLNKNLIIATSKAEVITRKTLQNLGIYKYFSFVCGSTLDGTRSKKSQIIQYVLEKNNLEKDSCVMIGDTFYDVIGAKETNIDSIGVLYGYGTYDELKKENPTYIIESIRELHTILYR